MTVDQSKFNTLQVGEAHANLGRSDREQGRTTRRQLLTTALAVPMVSGLAAGSALAAPRVRVRPGMAGWPKPADWSTLGRALGGRLAPVSLPALSPAEAATRLSNPFYLGRQPGLTQSSGWIDGWRSAPSSYVVHARDAADVSVAVRFAQRHGLRLVVKGGGHSYVGGSNAPDSLLIWTRAMDAIALHEDFVPAGSRQSPQPAVSLGAGCIWLQAYSAVTTAGGRYVQGGGCTTVGVAGFIQGGGFGSFSKAYGLGAASLLEAEIVTADGVVRVVNADREPDLFWALKGGGGGTFGVVTRLTLRTHDLPETFGAVFGTFRARSDDAFRTLLLRFLETYSTRLFNPHWGEQVRATPQNRLDISMTFQDLDPESALAAWGDFKAFVAANPEDYEVETPLQVLAMPARHFWDETFLSTHAPEVLTVDNQPGARPGDWFWAVDGEQAGAFWHGYQSAWMPARLLEQPGRARLAQAWFAASRHWSVAFHFNKGLAGADSATLLASRATAMNPQVLDAFALAIIAGDGPPAFQGLPEPDLPKARDNAERIKAAMIALRTVAPQAGAYLSECDFFTEHWAQSSWGEHWPRLSRIKRRYDPDGLFIVHHGVGSEAWSADGFTRLT